MSAPALRVASSWLSQRSLGEAYASGIDNFLLLRFLSATLVIYAHSYPLSGMRKVDAFVRSGFGVDGGNIAVCLFFCISGFLVTGSLARQRDVFAFLKARALRLLPAYLACLLICAYVLGSILTTLSLRDYLHNDEVARYVAANLSLREMHFVLPGVIFSNAEAGAVINGSIWTLPAEATMYLWLAALGLLGIFRRAMLATAVVLVLVPLAGHEWPAFPALITDARYLPFAGMFVLGTIAYLQRKYLPLGHGWMLAVIVGAWTLHGTAAYPYALATAEAYFCFWFAYGLPWHAFNRLGDYSYGLYLWGFPCEQLVVHHVGHPRPLLIALLAFPLALVFAVASWHCLEQPALRLKKVAIITRITAILRAWIARVTTTESNPTG